ncbi:hypothetical protein CRYUN_Cryun18bG0086700 [Craigia yunnanensis]
MDQTPGLNSITEYVMDLIYPGRPIANFIETVLAGTINLATVWWLLNSIDNICQDDLLPVHSPWTCPGDRVFFDASVIWGLVGPKRIFGSLRQLSGYELVLFLLGATGMMPSATPLNYNAWIIVGTVFNFFIFRYRKQWWKRYNYILSAALDAGVAFMAILLYFSVGMEKRSVTWWGTDGEHYELATCPTAKGIMVEGCPVN